MHEIISLPNGVRIIYEHTSSVRSAAVGIFVGVGSRHEKPMENGSAHFIEHMLFKRTKNHSAAELAYIMDGIGGQINAYTTREQTCFYAKVLDTHLNTAIELLSEMFFDCAFDEAEVNSERGVIAEEIGMYGDTPDDVCYEKLMTGCFHGALGRPVLGKSSTLAAMTSETLRSFKENHYTAGNIVLSLAGSFTQEQVDLLAKKFSCLPKAKKDKYSKASYTAHTVAKKKNTEQNQFCIAFPSNRLADDERFAINLLSTILGGGVSSRLFQNIREKNGLCYSIYSFQSSFLDSGLLAIAAAVNKETEIRTLSLIGEQLRKLVQDGVSETELGRAREQAKSSLVMGLESTSSRMLKLGNALTAIGKCMTTDEIIARYDAVTPEIILDLARNRIDFSNVSLSALGKVSTTDEYMEALIK